MHSQAGQLGSWQGRAAAHPAATRQCRKVTARTAGSHEQFLAPQYFRKRSRPDGESGEKEQVQLAAHQNS